MKDENGKYIINTEEDKLFWLADTADEIIYKKFKKGTCKIIFNWKTKDWGRGTYGYSVLIDEKYPTVFNEVIKPKLVDKFTKK